MGITHQMSERGYELALAVHREEMSRRDAVDSLVSETGMNEGSATTLMQWLPKLLAGQVYKRTENLYTTKYFLERIRDDFGLDLFVNALSSLEKHLDYYDEVKSGTYHPELRALLKQLSRAAGKEREAIKLAGDVHNSPIATDVAEPPKRTETTTSRIVRDTALANLIKVLHNYECQICGHTIHLADGSRYAESHHIKPLGRPHNGLDVRSNILCLCPNHHAACDLGAIPLDPSNLRVTEAHEVEQAFLEYHNQRIYSPPRSK